jgi:hypothetical protein
MLTDLNGALSLLANGLSKVDGSSEESVATSLSILSTVGNSLVTATKTFKDRLNTVLSDITYTI